VNKRTIVNGAPALAAAALISALSFGACSSKKTDAAAAPAESAKQVLTVGATPVPHAELLALVKDDLSAAGIELKIVEFTDYVTPNLALSDGQLDANFFQHVPYLESFSAEKGLKLASAFAVHVEPLGLYSSKVKSLEQLADGAKIAVPNDPTNEGRALLLLQAKGLIKISDKAGLKGTPADVTENPRKFKFVELEAAQLPRTLADVDAAVINGNFALESGLNPVKDALILEGAESPYANIVAVKAGNEQDPRILALAAALRSEKVRSLSFRSIPAA
jgi:D-methionine transport system substrate-binding protein